MAPRDTGVEQGQTTQSSKVAGEDGQIAGLILTPYPAPYDTPDNAMVREMSLEMRIKRDERGLKVPCSTTELPALFYGDSSSKIQERQRGLPPF
jgi:hypothetical protein